MTEVVAGAETSSRSGWIPTSGSPRDGTGPAEPDRTAESERNIAYRSWPDGELASAVLLHCTGAYDELFLRHSASITTASRMVLGRGPQSEDITSEVFFEFWCSPEKFDPKRGTFLGYMRVKARGRSIDYVRSETARRCRELSNGRFAGVVVPDSDSGLISSESAAHLRHAVSRLPRPERDAIDLAFFDGMTYAAVALQLELPEGTVKSRIRRALRRLAMDDEVQIESAEHGLHPMDDPDCRAGVDTAVTR